jgi:hypothetical protein
LTPSGDPISLGGGNAGTGSWNTSWGASGPPGDSLEIPVIASPGYNSPTTVPGIGNHVQTDSSSSFLPSVASRNLTLPTLSAGDSLWFSYQTNVLPVSGNRGTEYFLTVNGIDLKVSFADLGSGKFFESAIANNLVSEDGKISSGVIPASLAIDTTPNPIFMVGQLMRNVDVTPGVANLTFNLYTPADPNNPISLTNPLPTVSPLTTLTGDFTSYGTSTNSIVFLTMFSGGFDEIAFGASLADVSPLSATEPVPEPATLAVLALGALGALRRRRSS